jgi:DNA-binding Lrp family transcriptional regulator
MATRGPDPKVTDQELIHTIRTDARPFATARSVADEVSLSRERVRQRLNRLAEEGSVERAKVAGGIVLYWLEDSPFSESK